MIPRTTNQLPASTEEEQIWDDVLDATDKLSLTQEEQERLDPTLPDLDPEIPPEVLEILHG